MAEPEAVLARSTTWGTPGLPWLQAALVTLAGRVNREQAEGRVEGTQWSHVC